MEDFQNIKNVGKSCSLIYIYKASLTSIKLTNEPTSQRILLVSCSAVQSEETEKKSISAALCFVGCCECDKTNSEWSEGRTGYLV